jgi:Tfp pilus assembly protein PilN
MPPGDAGGMLMRAILRQRLDFARPQATVKLGGHLLGVVVLAAGVALCAGLFARYQSLNRELEAAERSIERLARITMPGRQLHGNSRAALIEEVRWANQAAAQLTIPWDDLFSAVESATDKQIALLSLQPSFSKAELRIAGEADDFGALRRYLDRLDASEVLEGVQLVSHEVVNRGAATPIRFELTAKWKVRA